jgi:phosphinothricin acetyltransferase
VTRPLVRAARPEDAPALADIYNHYVLHTPITFDVTPVSAEERRRWIAEFAETGRYRLRVVEDAGSVLGWACSRRFRDRAAYDPSIEVSVYLHPECGQRGVGTLLYDALFRAIAAEDIHRAYAGITLPNDASVAIHRRFGFEDCGRMREVGRKFDRYWDVLWMERRFAYP